MKTSKVPPFRPFRGGVLRKVSKVVLLMLFCYTAWAIFVGKNAAPLEAVLFFGSLGGLFFLSQRDYREWADEVRQLNRPKGPKSERSDSP